MDIFILNTEIRLQTSYSLQVFPLCFSILLPTKPINTPCNICIPSIPDGQMPSPSLLAHRPYYIDGDCIVNFNPQYSTKERPIATHSGLKSTLQRFTRQNNMDDKFTPFVEGQKASSECLYN